MENKRKRFTALHWYILLEIILLAAILAYWWFMGEHTVRRFSDVSFFGGVLAMFIGFVIYRGTRASTGSFNYQFASTASDEAMHERVHRDWKERFANEKLILVIIILGAMPIILGILADKIWG